MAQVIFLEIRDCDRALGTPEYEENVKALLRKTRTHPKVIENIEAFDKEIKEATKKHDDVSAEINNRWESDLNQKTEELKEIDYEKIESIILSYLAKYHVTWKKQERDDL